MKLLRVLEGLICFIIVSICLVGAWYSFGHQELMINGFGFLAAAPATCLAVWFLNRIASALEQLLVVLRSKVSEISPITDQQTDEHTLETPKRPMGQQNPFEAPHQSP